MVLIYIRHSDDSKKYQEGIYHRDDAKITKRGRMLAQKISNELINKYGHPDIIYLSPFMRTKQTLEEMKKKFKKNVEIKYDNRLSRYFSSKEKKNPSCFTETFNHDVPIYENWDQFRLRVNKNFKQMLHRKYTESDKVVWCITHALPFKQIAEMNERRIPLMIPFMHYFRIRKRSVKYTKRNIEKQNIRLIKKINNVDNY